MRKCNILPILLFLSIVCPLDTFAQSGEEVPKDAGILMEDGTIRTGTVLEHRIGEYLILADRNGNIVYLPDITIRSIEHSTESFPAESHSVFYLRNGLMIRGHLVRYGKDGEIEVRALNEQIISLPEEGVVKVVHLPGASPEAGSADPGSNEIMREAITLQLELTMGGKIPTAPSETSQDDHLSSLEEEISELEESLDQTEGKAAEQSLAENQERVTASLEEVEAAVSELAALAYACDAGGPTRTKGEPLKTGQDRSAVEFMRTAIAEPSCLSSRPLGEIQSSVESCVGRLRQQAGSPAASDEHMTFYQEQAEATGQINEILNGHKRFGPFVCYRVSSLSKNLPEDTRRSIYEAHRIDNAAGSAVQNIIPVLNWGSWQQGDGLHALLAGAGQILIAVLTYLVVDDYTFNYTGSTELREVGGTWMLVAPSSASQWVDTGFAVVGATCLYSVIRPFWYAHRQNVDLAEALGIETRGPQW